MRRRWPTAIPIRPSSTKSTRSRTQWWTFAQGLQQAIQKGDVEGWLELARAADRRISGAEPGAPPLPAARGQGAVPAGPGRQADQARQPRSTHRAGRRGAAGQWATCSADDQPNGSQARRQQDCRGRHRPPIHAALVAAVKKLQGECGFKPDGIIGGDTLDALNAGPAYRARQLRDRDGAAALAAAQSARQRGSTSTRRRRSSIIGATGSTSTIARSSTASPTSRRRSCRRRSSASSPTRRGPCPKGIGEKELPTKSPAWLQDNSFVAEGRPVRPAVRARRIRSASSSSTWTTRRRSICTTRRPRRCSACPTDTAATAASGSRMRCSSRPRSPQQEGVLDQFQQAMADRTTKLHQAAEPDPGAPALPDRLLGRLERPVPAGRLRLGRQCREGARARARSRRKDRAAGEQRRRRSVR